MVRRGLSLLVLSAVLGASALADIAVRPVTSDIDAEFARAADLLESGERKEAQTVLDEIRRRSGQRAWEVRIAMLLAADDERRKDFGAAEQRLRGAEAGAIGLEPYRRDHLARVLDAAGRLEEAAAEWQGTLESDEVFAWRARVGRELARALEKLGRKREALAALERAAAVASGSEVLAVNVARVRIALSLDDAASASAAAQTLLLRAPSSDVSSGVPTAVRNALRAEERRLPAALRARRGRALVAAGDAKRGLRLLSERPTAWPSGERAANQLAVARAQAALGRKSAAEASVARVPTGTPEWFSAGLLRGDLVLERLRAKSKAPNFAKSPAAAAVRRIFEPLVSGDAPRDVRAAARERLVRLWAEAGDFDVALANGRELTREFPGTVRGFEPIWELAWERWRARDFRTARQRFEALAGAYDDIWRDRRLAYWRARCLEREGRRSQAEALYASLVAADPVDVYADFARRRFRGAPAGRSGPVQDPSAGTGTAEFRRTDELLRLRRFDEATAEARLLEPSRGRDLRLAEADFARGRFLAAATAAKRALPELGTAEEGRVPDGWRRLHYPVEDGNFLPARAREFRIDASLLRGLVRQESAFNPTARSRAGALGLMQLMPGTAQPLARSVLRVRYRRAFLYDPGVNARLGAAYLRRLLDRFRGNAHYALAAYNGGPARMSRVLAENRGRGEDEILESHPFHETRDYVRRVLLYAESYRQLYPVKAAGAP